MKTDQETQTRAIEERPWGNFCILHKEKGMQVKRLELKAGLRFSLQKHMKRTENWFFISGEGIVTLGEKEIAVKKGSFLTVPQGEIHRLHNTGKKALLLIEVQLGDYLGEDDIVRLADDFGR